MRNVNIQTTVLALLLLPVLSVFGQTEAPLRIFIRAGAKTHGPGQHDHPRFLEEGRGFLRGRGAECNGAMDFPTAEQLGRTDVLVMYLRRVGR